MMKNIPNYQNITKRPLNIGTKLPKIFQMTIKFSILKPSKINPNLDFWLEKMYTIWQPWSLIAIFWRETNRSGVGKFEQTVFCIVHFRKKISQQKVKIIAMNEILTEIYRWGGVLHSLEGSTDR
jgi:hypothetical protein